MAELSVLANVVCKVTAFVGIDQDRRVIQEDCKDEGGYSDSEENYDDDDDDMGMCLYEDTCMRVLRPKLKKMVTIFIHMFI